ncbi:hypothetical protein GCM10022243_10550 [Saccharothrix violaceirubra]|uniref:Crotonobetainyl-CoA:carnitine CoA-transferase CaiB-like acyl-CoA transferase n=1 Tax=Saccharothrix violaceirubra TaxID=413306 RepID=A0A7W7T6G9_9PSEU|nr:CoA transferase [Saccharothrix violaceirubra]MBB4966105.1 crotonobetainyl-CoA:carnitine CoA-transferase CaiB-like acyl-CoA transferase [Saccharothrix violaceirubra]
MTSGVGAPTAVGWSGPLGVTLTGEADVQAACGLMHVHGRRFGRPTALEFDYASALGAELAGLGFAAAELGRARWIPVRALTTSVAQAALLAVSPYLAAATADEPVGPFEPGGPPFVSVEGIAFDLDTDDEGAWSRFWTVLGAEHRHVAQGWLTFPHRYETACCPLPPELFALTARTPIVAVEDIAEETGPTVARLARRAVEDLPPYVVSALPTADLTPDPRREARPDAAPLSGIVVVESVRRTRGPVAGLLLGFLGATVVRVEPPGGDPDRAVRPLVDETSARYHAFNRDKRVVELDPGTPAGLLELAELLAGADVFVHDWTSDEAVARSLDPQALDQARPGLVTAYLSGSAGEFPVQARTGVPHTLMTVVDVFGGVVAARAVVEALTWRRRTGQGQYAEASRSAAASRLNARTRLRSASPRTVPVCTDLAALGADPAFAAVLRRDGCLVPVSPWTVS